MFIDQSIHMRTGLKSVIRGNDLSNQALKTDFVFNADIKWTTKMETFHTAARPPPHTTIGKISTAS